MRRLIMLFGSTLLAGCSLRGLVFDLDGSGGAGGTGGTGASSTGSSGTGGSPMCMTASSSSGSGSSEVSCTNGLDDDNNGVADCKDPTCQTAGYTCYDVPAGWIGPIALYEGDPTQSPCCPSDYPTRGPVGGSGATAQPVTCSACSCSPATAKCIPSPLVTHTDPTCLDAGSPKPQQVGTCAAVTGSHFRAAAPTVMMGACTPLGGAPVTPQPLATWTTGDQLCLGDTIGQGCTGTQVCARPAPGVFGDRVCVYAAGAQAMCPAGFLVKHSFFTGFDDTRKCGPCSCGSPAPPACAATSTFFSTQNCSGGPNKVVANMSNNGICTTVVGAVSFETNAPDVSTSCAPSGGGAIGMVTGATASELTVCCTQ